MPGKSLTPDQIAQAVAMRAAGYTVTAISHALGISVRTVNRVLERHATKKGAVRDELVETAKRDLIQTVISNEQIKQEAAKLVTDDLAHVRLLRERMVLAAEHLTATNLPEAALVMRAAAAYSTAIKNTSDVARHSLRTDKALDAVEATDLPELRIVEISAEDALRLRKSLDDEPEDAGAGPVTASAPEAPGEGTEENERLSEGEDDTT